jgi:hypothetical protein
MERGQIKIQHNKITNKKCEVQKKMIIGKIVAIPMLCTLLLGNTTVSLDNEENKAITTPVPIQETEDTTYGDETVITFNPNIEFKLMQNEIQFIKEDLNKTPEEMFNKYFPEEDYQETIMVLAKTLHGEAEGVDSITNKAAVIWCILNRVDVSKRGDTPIQCAKARKQFAYSKNEKPRQDEIDLVKDVLDKWILEKEGLSEEVVGRVLDKIYTFFVGYKGYNHFYYYISKNEKSKKYTPKHSNVYGD